MFVPHSEIDLKKMFEELSLQIQRNLVTSEYAKVELELFLNMCVQLITVKSVVLADNISEHDYYHLDFNH